MSQVVGRKGKRRDIDDTPAVNLWKTDIIENEDPDFAYQFFREDQVRDKLRADRLILRDYNTGEQTAHNIPGWEIVRRDIGPEEAAGWRPDEGKPVDNVLRHGPMVCMKLPKKHWELIRRAQEQRAGAYDERLRGGGSEQFQIDGQKIRPTTGKLPAGDIRINEHPLARV